MLMPGASSINHFPLLPNSSKSTLAGDTLQVPNIVGYFSNNYRQFVTSFYQTALQDTTPLPFKPIRLNYPPEFAFTAIKDQTQSTYLEEYAYPLRDSIFINGLEPFYADGQPKYWGAHQSDINGTLYDTKVTLRYYSSSGLTRILVWMGISISMVLLWILSKRIIKE